MLKTEEVKVKGFETVIYMEEDAIGMKGYVAINDTSLGPAVGGCRMLNYDSLGLALKDALKLSRGMTYKAAAAGLNYGGGKTVIVANDINSHRRDVFRALGKVVNSLKGRYITGIDAGTSLDDMKILQNYTRYVSGVPNGEHGVGDPSMATAYGVYMGMKACVKEAFDRSDFQGLKVAIQGAGKVGRYLIERLTSEGCKVVLAEPNEDKALNMSQEYGVDLVKPSRIYSVEADIFSPCALGGVLNGRTIPKLKCKIVAGAANNQLVNPQAGESLHDRGILYAPDFVVNTGGLICVVMDREGADMRHILEKTAKVYDTLAEIFRTSRTEGTPTYLIADRIAERRIIKAHLARENFELTARKPKAGKKRSKAVRKGSGAGTVRAGL